jgi:hypothetical protein
MFLPDALDRLRVEVPLLFEAACRKQVAGPFAQGAAKPVTKGDPEAHLGSIDEALRDVAIENLT